MTVHKLTAGDGYTYLTRQVASADEPRPRGQSLADYYTARGNPPGVWVGGGSQSLGVVGTTVSEAQMKALFGEGRHPERDAMLAAGAPEAATRLGPGLPRLDGADGRRPVAGYDLVFTPVKSASLLWALGGPEVRAQVEAAHHEAVANTLGWVEQHAAFTRTGHAGVAQVDTTGLVAAAFDHRESRSGDPDLHTHVAVANKVCGIDGRWRSLDARVLYALGVAASERYNTRFEDALARRLGVEFADRPQTDPGKRPVREVVGVPAQLISHFSKRRAAIEDRYAELLADYRTSHGKEAPRTVQLRLAQQATLETREGKAPGRTLAEQVAAWTDEATAVLGRGGVTRLLNNVLGRGSRLRELDDEQTLAVARQVVLTVSSERSTWTRWNLHAEAERVLRAFRFPSAEAREAATDRVMAVATSDQLSIRISEPELVAEPPSLRRSSDGQSVFTVHGAERYTTSAILQAEESLVAAAFAKAETVDALVVEAALLLHETQARVRLDAGQRRLVEFFAGYPAQLSVGIGPAGSGKTTAMRAYAAVLAADGWSRWLRAPAPPRSSVASSAAVRRTSTSSSTRTTPAVPVATVGMAGSGCPPVTWCWSTRRGWPAPSSSPSWSR
jgi:conjugative relaxase-like TrwC/TraI family protein